MPSVSIDDVSTPVVPQTAAPSPWITKPGSQFSDLPPKADFHMLAETTDESQPASSFSWDVLLSLHNLQAAPVSNFYHVCISCFSNVDYMNLYLEFIDHLWDRLARKIEKCFTTYWIISLLNPK